ncbi:MAG: TonB-dependent receptor plug domain-containing protein, partial [Candidatus Cybelea sp.]
MSPRRSIAAAVSLLLLLAAVTPSAIAQSDSGEIDIVVVDASTKQPLELARVLLDGPVIASEITGKNGKVVFTDVPDGIYRARIVRRDYTSLTSASFEVLDGRIVTVSFSLALATGGLKVIGQVTAKASATISSTSIDQNSPQRRLSTDLADALNKLSGVTVSTSSDDSDATQTISLEGHDPSQTQLTLDGIPLNAPGSTGNLGGFATDLFQGASVHAGATLGGLGGSVNFSTLQPTLSWISQIQISTGSYGRYNYSIAETGSDGKLG